MITIAQVITDIVQKTPFLEEGLSSNLINISSLARKVQPEIEEKTMKSVSTAAIIMALKRFVPTLKRKAIHIDIASLIQSVMVKSNICEITCANSPTLFLSYQKFLEQHAQDVQLYCSCSQGIYESTFLMDVQYKESFLEIFHNEKVLDQTNSIAAVIIRLDKKNVVTPGLYYVILKSLAWENINILESNSTHNELSIFVADEDIQQVFGIIKKLV